MLETVIFQPDKLNLLCAVCASDRSGGQIALFIIITSFISLGLANWAYKKYIKNNPKFIKIFKI
ncbi:MAG: hypothetical protein EVA75_02220 [Candidatus Pelagibacterales bacterium]|nr:MAG: hypothetical protein CBD93_000500 [Pelagibacteraceae bacterium TMED233]RZO62662.1 MAG: hypothetical protein EVA75_02220 [Pelagibacterales bacterium]|tara:strand:- start:3714 stop:3905 length:192 start_codon:yes stop_codon:yes gene_type:complete